MDESSGSPESKMFYLKATFVNMIRYLATLEEGEIYIQVNCFDTECSTIIQPVRVSKNNAEDLIGIIKSITADGMTRLDKPLSVARDTFAAYLSANPTHKGVHIFMTDGTPTAGEKNGNHLSSLVDDGYTNIFIGFGGNHNSELLRKCSNKKHGSYLFIDDAENTAVLYGETLHQVLYPAMTDVRICLENGLIYNWKTNEWLPEIHEEVVIGDCEKVYHIKRTEGWMMASVYGQDLSSKDLSNKDLSSKDLSSKDLSSKDLSSNSQDSPSQGPPLLEEIDELPLLKDLTTGEVNYPDVARYLFRQKVLECLYQATHYSRTEQRVCKNAIQDIFRKIRRYMREQNIVDDPFMTRLCDDLKIVYSTLGTGHGIMFATARHTSQGYQQLFSPSNISREYTPELNTPNPSIFDYFPRRNQDGDEDDVTVVPMYDWQGNLLDDDTVADEYDEDLIDNYTQDSTYLVNDVSCYTSPSLLRTVRQMSQPTDL
jgi:hypothetical protein